MSKEIENAQFYYTDDDQEAVGIMVMIKTQFPQIECIHLYDDFNQHQKYQMITGKKNGPCLIWGPILIETHSEILTFLKSLTKMN